MAAGPSVGIAAAIFLFQRNGLGFKFRITFLGTCMQTYFIWENVFLPSGHIINMDSIGAKEHQHGRETFMFNELCKNVHKIRKQNTIDSLKKSSKPA